MRHQVFREWIPLLVYEELGDDEQASLRTHLTTCGECSERLRELTELRTLCGEGQEVTPALLESARQELRVGLRTERLRSANSRWTDLRVWVTAHPSFAAAAVCLSVGIGIGYLWFGLGGGSAPAASRTPSAGTAWLPAPSETKLNNLRFIDADASDGEIELAFEAVRPGRLRGRLDDERMQDILSYALVHDGNPGTRLRAANVLKSASARLRDQEVKQALITTLTTDENGGVRKQALAALHAYPFDEEIRDAFLCVLRSDPNPALRIAAINGIAAQRFRDPQVLKVLKEKSLSDGNEYIRLRSRAVLEEVDEP
jgi:hypothetical protein